MNLVLDDVRETMRGKTDTQVARYSLIFATDEDGNETTRSLGLIVARGTLLVLISPVDGSEEIENPFQQAAEE